MGHVSGEPPQAVRLFRKPPCSLPVALYWDASVLSTTIEALFLSGGRLSPWQTHFVTLPHPQQRAWHRSGEAAYSAVKTGGSGASVVLCAGFRGV